MPTNPDGTLRPFNDEEITAMQLETRGVRDGSHPSESFSPAGSGCTRKWFCKWESRFDAVRHLVGQVAIYADGAGDDRITRLLPQAHPDFAKWICTKADITGFQFDGTLKTTGGSGNKLPNYSRAEITANYEQVPFKLATDEEIDYDTEILRYVTEPGYPEAEGEPFAEYITLPGGVLRYQTVTGVPPHGQGVLHNIGFTQGGEKIHAIWRRVPNTAYQPGSNLFTRIHGDPVNDVRPMIGSVNSAALFGRPALTCLLESVLPRRRPDPATDPIGTNYSWDLKFTWVYKPQTHFYFYFWDAKSTPTIDNNWYSIKRGDDAYIDPETFGDTDSLFPRRDHAADLFRINA